MTRPQVAFRPATARMEAGAEWGAFLHGAKAGEFDHITT